MNFVGLNITCRNYLYWTASTLKMKKEDWSIKSVLESWGEEAPGLFMLSPGSRFSIAKMGWMGSVQSLRRVRLCDPVNCNTGEKVLIFILFFNCSHFSLCFGVSSKIGQVACESLSTWMWELDYKKAECWRIDVLELWCLRRLLRVPWTSRRSNQSIRKEISPVCSLEGLMLKLKLQYFGHLMRGADSLEKILMLRKIEGRRRRDNRGCDGWMASPTQWTWVWINSGSWWWTGRPGMLQSMGSQIVRHDWVTEQNWTEGQVESQHFVK